MSKPRELLPTKPIQTPLREQVYKCSSCGREYRADCAAYGGRVTGRSATSYMITRFNKHTCAYEGR